LSAIFQVVSFITLSITIPDSFLHSVRDHLHGDVTAARHWHGSEAFFCMLTRYLLCSVYSSREKNYCPGNKSIPIQEQKSKKASNLRTIKATGRKNEFYLSEQYFTIITSPCQQVSIRLISKRAITPIPSMMKFQK